MDKLFFYLGFVKTVAKLPPVCSRWIIHTAASYKPHPSLCCTKTLYSPFPTMHLDKHSDESKNSWENNTIFKFEPSKFTF